MILEGFVFLLSKVILNIFWDGFGRVKNDFSSVKILYNQKGFYFTLVLSFIEK